MKAEEIKANLAALESIKESFNAMLKEAQEKPKEPQPKYPIYCLSKKTGAIVRFDGLDNGIVVRQSDTRKVGEKLSSWHPHSDENSWERLLFNKERGLYDTQLVEFWDDGYLCGRHRGFYNAKNDSIFNWNGERLGAKWDNIIPVEGNWPDWAIEAHKTLKR